MKVLVTEAEIQAKLAEMGMNRNQNVTKSAVTVTKPVVTRVVTVECQECAKKDLEIAQLRERIAGLMVPVLAKRERAEYMREYRKRKQ